MTHKKNINHNCPIPLPPQGCPSIFPQPMPPPPPPKIKKKIVSNEFCGTIKQNCNGEFVEYWKVIQITPLPSGTVTVLNTSDCMMTVRADTNGDGIADTVLFTLTENEQAKSITLGAISSLEISCENRANQKCSGRYCINTHFERHCTKD
jgi:hypothetical protein